MRKILCLTFMIALATIIANVALAQAPNDLKIDLQREITPIPQEHKEPAKEQGEIVRFDYKVGDGEKYAKIMFVIGLDYSSERGEYSYETNPYWKENFKLVFLLLEKLEEKCPGITYGIALRRTPYNQNLSPNSLLAEIGFEGNLASEAARTAGLLAETVAEVYS